MGQRMDLWIGGAREKMARYWATAIRLLRLRHVLVWSPYHCVRSLLTEAYIVVHLHPLLGAATGLGVAPCATPQPYRPTPLLPPLLFLSSTDTLQEAFVLRRWCSSAGVARLE